MIAAAVAFALLAGAPAATAGETLQTPIRVSLVRRQFQAVVSSEGGLIVRAKGAKDSAPYVAPDVTTVLDVRPSGSGLLLADAIHTAGAVVVSPASPDFPLSVDGRTYRGSAIVQTDVDGSLDVINLVDLEQYLYSVVGSEIDSEWPAAALRAQAIVARTYALAHLGTRDWLGYDLQAGEQDQAYAGMDAEAAPVIAAVDATRGSVLVYGADLVHAYYSSCDGGYKSSGEALGDPQPYLTAVRDRYCTTSPDERWVNDVPTSTFRAAFARRYGDIGPIRSIRLGPADGSGRRKTVTVIGSEGPLTIPATVFRLLAGRHVVRSTRIFAIDVSPTAIRVVGSGFGHGVGMAQWGARAMAEDGRSTEDILTFYYPGSTYARIADRLGER